MKQIAIKLSESDIAYLEGIVNKGKNSARIIKRARVLLELQKGHSGTVAALAAGVSSGTVTNIRQRYQDEAGDVKLVIKEKDRPGQPPKITPEVEARLTALACSQSPDGRSKWALRLLADKAVELGYVESLSHEAVRKFLKKASSNPGKKGSGASAK